MQGYDCAHIWFNIAAAGANNVMAKKREMAQRKMIAQQVELAQRMAQESMSSSFTKC